MKSVLFLVVIYLCVLFEIESWPFSDFRVYQGRFHPERVSSYRLAVRNQSREKWLFEGVRAKRNNVINHIFAMMQGEITQENFERVASYEINKYCMSESENWDFVALKKITLVCLDRECEKVQDQHQELYQMRVQPCTKQ